MILEHINSTWKCKYRQSRWRPKVGKRETPEGLENRPCEKGWGQYAIILVQGSWERKKIQTWRVAISVSYAEYLGWAAHATEFLVAKPASYLMSSGCLGHVFQNGLPLWNKILEVGQLWYCWCDHCVCSQKTMRGFWLSEDGGWSGHVLWSLAECGI